MIPETTLTDTFAADVIRTEFPKLAEKMHVRTAVLAWQSRVMDLIDSSGSLDANAIDPSH